MSLWANLRTAWKNLTLAGLGLKPETIAYSSTATARLRWQGIFFSFAIVAASTALLLALNTAPYNVNMLFMLLTLVATVWFGLGTGVLTAVLGFLCFDYFFIPPYFTFVIDAGQGWVAVFLFLGTALFANQVAGRARASNRQAQQRAHEATALYDLATTVITKIDQTEMLRLVLQKVNEALDTAGCTLFLDGESAQGESERHLIESLKVENASQAQITFLTRPQPDPGMAEAVFNHNRTAFYSGPVSLKPDHSEPFFGKNEPVEKGWGAAVYVPLAYGSGRLGVMVLVRLREKEGQEYSPEEKRLVQVFANHVALAVEHAQLIKEAAQVTALREADHLKSALLASVSHELRTPLTSIKTATANLESKNIIWTESDRAEVLKTIEQETERLARLVSNLLDLSKIEAHALQPNFDWYYLPEIIMRVVERLRKTPLVGSHPISTSFTPDLPLARLDFLQIDQVLTNLVENAAKYSLPGSTITVQVECLPVGQLAPPPRQESDFFEVGPNQQALVVKVLDEGQNIPPQEFERIFDKFYRIQAKTGEKANEIPGTGLGLAISKGIIEAHAGKIWVQNRLYGGNVFTFVLPVTPLDPRVEFEED
jgi:two-component system sensor histidine kinase KdpD